MHHAGHELRFAMAVYTVHEPPPKQYEQTSDPERFEFIRDGFSFWAFLFGPLWMLRHRMWIMLLGYGLAIGALEAILHGFGASAGARIAIGVLIAFLVGFEAASLRRFTLARRKWRDIGI